MSDRKPIGPIAITAGGQGAIFEQTNALDLELQVAIGAVVSIDIAGSVVALPAPVAEPIQYHLVIEAQRVRLFSANAGAVASGYQW